MRACVPFVYVYGQGVLESCWVTIPLMFLQTGGQITLGETPAVHAFGQAAFQAMTLTVNMKIIFVQKVTLLCCPDALQESNVRVL